MRHIRKCKEPISFTEWKNEANENWQPTWDNFSDDRNNPTRKPRSDVHHALLTEQGFICCYCGIAIARELEIDPTLGEENLPSHIEHFKPRTYYRDLELDYGNFLASCGKTRTDYTKQQTIFHCQEHCGQKKGNSLLPISPLQIDCSDFFKFSSSGRIEPTDNPEKKQVAQQTIDLLNLNHEVLINRRSTAISAALLDIEQYTNDEIQKLIQGYDEPNSKGKYSPFCTAIVDQLKKYLYA